MPWRVGLVPNHRPAAAAAVRHGPLHGTIDGGLLHGKQARKVYAIMQRLRAMTTLCVLLVRAPGRNCGRPPRAPGPGREEGDWCRRVRIIAVSWGSRASAAGTSYQGLWYTGRVLLRATAQAGEDERGNGGRWLVGWNDRMARAVQRGGSGKRRARLLSMGGNFAWWCGRREGAPVRPPARACLLRSRRLVAIAASACSRSFRPRTDQSIMGRRHKPPGNFNLTQVSVLG